MVSGAVLLALSVALYVAIPDQVVTTEGDTLTPASLPTMLAVVIGALSAALLVQGLATRRRAAALAEAEATAAGPRIGYVTVAAVIAVATLYIAAIPRAGYLLGTGAALVALALLYGNRSWKQILLLALIAPPAILLFFRYTMLVLLPQGRLFG